MRRDLEEKVFIPRLSGVFDDSDSDADAEPGVETEKEVPKGSFPRLEVLGADDFEDDEPEEEDEEFDEEDEQVRTVLITGAAGNIGRKLREAWNEVYDLILIDRTTDAGDPDLIVADLAEFDESWVGHFHGVDTVIHLAADPNEFASWEDLQNPNLDALCNVFHAAALAGVDRLIFASSNHAMGDYRDLGDMPITVDLPPRPDGSYGAGKLMGERLGRSLSAAFDISFVALRLGWIQHGANRPETLPDDQRGASGSPTATSSGSLIVPWRRSWETTSSSSSTASRTTRGRAGI